MRVVLALVGFGGLLLTAAAAFPLPGGVSPDGYHLVTLEPAPPTRGPTSGGQILAIHEPGAFATAASVSTGHYDEPVTTIDRPRIEWNPTSSFFVFSFRRANRVVGQIVTVNTGVARAAGTTGGVRTVYFSDVSGPEQIVSYKFIGPRRLWLKTVTFTGQGSRYVINVATDGSVKATAYRPQ